ncbi:MAG: Ig-like domain repeat protein [Chloroflexi bacterium]|nr:Ig-like domain repeat protein [Chloroflexota bacterium]
MDANGDCGDPGGGGRPVYQPPTISHVLNCSNSGSNGWCIGALSLDLTASDPQGQSIVISGTVNGVAFACPSGQTTCSIPLPEAAGTATYKVDSATGLSVSGSTSYQLDVTTPQISGDINGSAGTNGWYTSQTTVTASASDALSGVYSLEVSVNGSSWSMVNGPLSFTDGMHTIQFRATDNAGNVTETALQSVNVDTTAPTLNVSTTGTNGTNGWYVSAVTFTPTANDATSGLYSLEVTTDGSTWSIVNGPLSLNDGIYTVQFRATDNAGNISQTPSQQIKVDATTPSLSLNFNGTRGQNDWYISSVTVTPNVSDAGSGINKVEASVNHGAWATVTNPLSFTDGVHSYQIRVTDNAGNMTETPVLPMMVDSVPPAIAMDDDSLDLGDTLYYDLEDTTSGLWINRSVIEDDAEKYKKIVWLEELTGNKSNDNEIRWDGMFADGAKAAPGQYFITLKISDQAGNETMRTAIVEVTAFNSILPIPAFTPPVSTLTEPAPSSATATNEQSFGGSNNGNVGTETTTTHGETVFANMSIQAGGTNSFTAGNQSTNVPNTNPNILWGAAAAAMLGMTLAEWQKKRQEEEAARLAAMSHSGGDEDGYSDVLAKKKAKVMAKNQAKRDQESRWEAARQQKAREQAMQDHRAGEKNAVAIADAYESQKAIQSHREGERDAVSIAEAYKAQEQAKQNAVDAARWAGLASVALGKEEEGKKKTTWLNNPILNTAAEFVAGVGYQFLVVNNLNPLMTIVPAPSTAKEGWFAGWNQYEHKADSTAFTIGRIVGGVLGIVQGVWEIFSGIATATGGTVVSCGTVVLCIGGGGASIAAGSALVAHGAVVTAVSAYQTGLQIQALMAKGQGNYGKMTQQQIEDSIQSNERNIIEHTQKLEKYKAGPMSQDNQGLLKNAPSDAIRQLIIKNRIKKLEREILKFQNEIRKLQALLE